MNPWIFRTVMALLAVNIAVGGYVLVMYTPPTPMCLGGIVMVPDKGGDMWIQRGLWPTHCMPVDRD